MSRPRPLTFTVIAGLLTFASASLPASEPSDSSGSPGSWMTDFEAAKKLARKEGKDILIDFTGSDWCGWCIKLRKEVFDQAEFKKSAPDDFILVELDYPRRKQLEKSLREQNEELKTVFQIRGYPTVILADSEGRPYAKTGYRPGGAEEYLRHLESEQAKRAERDKLFARAREAEGVEGAKLLDRALSLIDRSQAPLVGYEPIYAEIVRFDADNEAGLRAKYELRASIHQLERLTAKREYEALIATADEILKGKLIDENRQKVLFYKAFGHYNQQRYTDAIAILEASIAAAPKSAQAANIERALAQVKEKAGQKTSAPKEGSAGGA